jgi:hypothetical protein
LTPAYDIVDELKFEGETIKYKLTHVLVTPETQRLRRRVTRDLQGVRGTHFAGAWLSGMAIHEDAIRSGLNAANAIMGGAHAYPLLEQVVPLHEPFALSAAAMGGDVNKGTSTMRRISTVLVQAPAAGAGHRAIGHGGGGSGGDSSAFFSSCASDAAAAGDLAKMSEAELGEEVLAIVRSVMPDEEAASQLQVRPQLAPTLISPNHFCE